MMNFAISNPEQYTSCMYCTGEFDRDAEGALIKFMGCLCSRECVRWFKLGLNIGIAIQQSMIGGSPPVTRGAVDLRNYKG